MLENDFTMHSNQSTNKLAANDNQIKLTIHDVQTISQYEYKKCTKKLDMGVEGDADGANETYH